MPVDVNFNIYAGLTPLSYCSKLCNSHGFSHPTAIRYIEAIAYSGRQKDCVQKLGMTVFSAVHKVAFV